MSPFSVKNWHNEDGGTTLTAAVDASQTTIPVTSAADFPTTGTYRIIVDTELMDVTAGQGTLTWTVTRGVGGSTAATHGISTQVRLHTPLNATGIEDMETRLSDYTDAQIAAIPNDGSTATPSRRTLGTGGNQAASGNDTRLSNERARVVRTTTAQSIPNSTDTLIIFNTESIDSASMVDLDVNSTRVTIPRAGTYIVAAQFVWASNSTGRRYASIQKNGLALFRFRQTALETSEMTVSGLVACAVSDYFELLVNQTSGGALDIVAGGANLMAVRIGPT